MADETTTTSDKKEKAEDKSLTWTQAREELRPVLTRLEHIRQAVKDPNDVVNGGVARLDVAIFELDNAVKGQ